MMAIEEVLFESRQIGGEIGHRDDRRRLISAYNGEFKAEVIRAVVASTPVEFSSPGDDSARLWFILEGSAMIEVQGKPGTYSLRALEESWDRLILPARTGYRASITPGSILVGAVEREIDEHNLDINVTDGKATYRTLFWNNVAGFAAAQLKFLLPFDKEVVLGKHYHDYGEAYSMMRGACTFRFEDITSHERQERSIANREGIYLLVPPRQAHSAKVDARAILVGCTQDSFSREGDSAKPYTNAWLEFKE